MERAAQRGVGLSLPNRGVLFGATTVEEMLELTQRADEGDFFSSVWVGDGLVAKARLEAVTSLTAIAARTSRVRLGVCCLATFSLRQPVLFALQWASLDVISQGRTQLAVCLGAATARSGSNPLSELAAMGIARNERVPRFEENIGILRGLWEGEFAHEGRFTRFPTIDLLPKPVQNPCPIWIASNPNPDVLSAERYQLAVDRVGRLADGWQSTVVAPEDFGGRWRAIKESAERHGRDPDQMVSSAHLMINISDDRAAARSEAKHFLDTYYSMDVDDTTMDRWGAFGTPDDVYARIEQYVEHGLDLPIVRFASFDQTEQLDRASEWLLPKLRDLCKGV